MTDPVSWRGRLLRYIGVAGTITALVVLAFWWFVDEAGRNGLLLAGAVVMVAQTLAFAGLASARPGTNRFLAIWIGGTIGRFAIVGVVGWVLGSMRSIDPVVALLTMAGLFFALILLELTAFRGTTVND